MMRRHLLVVAGAGVLVALAATAPTLARTDGSIVGVVTADSPDSRPVPQAVVTLLGGGLPYGQMAITDQHGAYAFMGLSADHYTMSVEKPGFVRAFFGSRRVGRGPGVPIAVADGVQVTASVALLPGAVVAGRVVDEHGRPRSLTTIELLDTRLIGTDLPVPTASGVTDSDGAYRMYGVPPGTYVVAAKAAFAFSGAHVPSPQEFTDVLAKPAHAVNYAPILFPSTTNAALATPITVRAGEERGGVDIALQLQPSARIDGRVIDPEGQVPQALELSYISPAQQLGFTERSSGAYVRRNSVVTTTAAGTFVQGALTPGHYTYFARAADSTAPGPRPTPNLWATVDVDIDGVDIPQFVITLRPGARVSGRALLPETMTPRDLSAVTISLSSLRRGLNFVVAPAHPTADGTFAFEGVPPGTYAVGVSGGHGVALASARLGSDDVWTSGLTVMPDVNIDGLTLALTDRPTTLNGRLTDALARPAPQYTIVVFPADRAGWTPGSSRIRTVHPSTDGRYSIVGVPAGDYLVAAVTDVEPADLDDPSFLELLASSATTMHFANGETLTRDLRIK